MRGRFQFMGCGGGAKDGGRYGVTSLGYHGSMEGARLMW